MAFRPILSIVIPVYNEEHNINALIESVEKTLSDHSYELIFVDDFSTDNTREVIEKHSNPHKILIAFECNKGQSSAWSLQATTPKPPSKALTKPIARPMTRRLQHTAAVQSS